MTTHAQLKSQTRTIVGNKVKTFTKLGLSPAVIYSKSFPSTPLTLNTRDFLKVYKETGRTGVIDLDIDGKITPCLVHDINVHPVKKTLRHVDFYAVNLKEKLRTEVPIEFIGEAPGVKEFGALLNFNIEKLEIEALPDQIPDEIQIDISSLVDFDSEIRVSDIPTSKTYTIIEDSETLVSNLVAQSEEEETETPVTEVGTDEKSDKAEAK
ncbi:MAG: 50S ribosomal protein L25 [Patescibacteria group bacterium]